MCMCATAYVKSRMFMLPADLKETAVACKIGYNVMDRLKDNL